jgi:hypothetical protein
MGETHVKRRERNVNVAHHSELCLGDVADKAARHVVHGVAVEVVPETVGFCKHKCECRAVCKCDASTYRRAEHCIQTARITDAGVSRFIGIALAHMCTCAMLTSTSPFSHRGGVTVIVECQRGHEMVFTNASLFTSRGQSSYSKGSAIIGGLRPTSLSQLCPL